MSHEMSGRFLFRRPERIADLGEEANTTIALGALASRLVEETRTRVDHPDGRAENVAEHAHMLARVASGIAMQYYPELDAGKIALFATFHDDVEAYVGDTPTDSVANHDPVLKKQREYEGLLQLKREYDQDARQYVALVEEYEAQKTAEAQFVGIFDKIMVLLVEIQNNGSQLREHYTHTQYVADIAPREEALMARYPLFPELAKLRTEIAHYVGKLTYEL